MCHCRLTILSVWHRQWKYRSSITWWTSHPNRPSIPTCPKGYAKARNAWVFLSSWWSAHGDSIFLKRVPLIWGHHTKLNSIVNNNAEFGNKSRYTHIYIYTYISHVCKCHLTVIIVIHIGFSWQLLWFNDSTYGKKQKQNMGEHLYHEHSSKKVLILARDPSSNCSSKTFSKEYSCLVYLGTMKKFMLQKGWIGFHGLEPSCRTWHASNQFLNRSVFSIPFTSLHPPKKKHVFSPFCWFQKSLDLTSIQGTSHSC